MIEERVTNLEIKFSHQDYLVEELNKIVSNQQLLIERLIQELQDLRVSMDGNPQSVRPLADDVPPHY